MMRVDVTFPGTEDEAAVLGRYGTSRPPQSRPANRDARRYHGGTDRRGPGVCPPGYMSLPKLLSYILAIATASREHAQIALGLSTRGSLALLLGSARRRRITRLRVRHTGRRQAGRALGRTPPPDTLVGSGARGPHRPRAHSHAARARPGTSGEPVTDEPEARRAVADPRSPGCSRSWGSGALPSRGGGVFRLGALLLGLAYEAAALGRLRLHAAARQRRTAGSSAARSRCSSLSGKDGMRIAMDSRGRHLGAGAGWSRAAGRDPRGCCAASRPRPSLEAVGRRLGPVTWPPPAIRVGGALTSCLVAEAHRGGLHGDGRPRPPGPHRKGRLAAAGSTGEQRARSDGSRDGDISAARVSARRSAAPHRLEGERPPADVRSVGT